MLGMDDDTAKVRRVLAKLRRTQKRSPLFYWLAENHDPFLGASDGERIDWKTVTAALSELGLTDAGGQALNPENVRLTWYRVRRFVAAKRARTGGTPRPVKLPPSNSSREVRPATVAALPAAQAPAPVQPVPPRSVRDIPALSRGLATVTPRPLVPGEKPIEQMTPKEKIEALRQTLKDDF
jgi:hypothetical protein